MRLVTPPDPPATPLLDAPRVEQHRTERIGWLRAAVWARTTASYRRPASSSASRRPMRPATTSWSPASPGWSPGRCRWPPASTSRSAPRRTPNRPTSPANAKNSPTDQSAELAELTAIYVARGLDPSLAKQVAEQLTAHDALAAHARDELGISELVTARPIPPHSPPPRPSRSAPRRPLGVAIIAPTATLPSSSAQPPSASSHCWAASPPTPAALRRPRRRPRHLLGALAMAATAAIGLLFGVTA